MLTCGRRHMVRTGKRLTFPRGPYLRGMVAQIFSSS
jgi:hypothetical protein